MAITPEVKAAVDNLLNDWDASGGKGKAQRVLRDFSSAANSVPANTSGATDEQRLGYALDVLKAFKEGGWAFSTKGYQGYMGKVVPLVQAYAPAQNIFPLWKSTAEIPATIEGGYTSPSGDWITTEPVKREAYTNVNYAQWEDIAKQLGYTGPVYGTVGYDTEGGGITGIDPQFKSFVDQKRAEGYDFVQYQPDLRNYRQKYGFRLPDGQVVGEYYGEGRDADVTSFFKQFVLPAVGAYFGAGALGNALAPVTNALTGVGGAGSIAAGGALEGLGAVSGNIVGASGVPIMPAVSGGAGALTAADLTNFPTDALAGGGDAAGAAGGDVLTGGTTAPSSGGFLRNMSETAVTEGAGVAGTGILTKGTNIPSAVLGGGDLLDKALKFIQTPAGGAIVSGAGNIVGGIAAGEAAKEAAQTQAASADAATQLQRDIYNKFMEMNKPYYEAGVNALGQITRGEITAEPGYGFRLGEGMKALERLQASRGNLLSGGALKAGQRFAQDLASEEYGKSFNRLANIAGIGQNAAGAAGTAGQNYAGQAGELGMQGANALVSGRIGRTSAYTSGAQGAIGALQGYQAQQRQDQLLNRMLDIYGRTGG
jgi:hypothetical protein